MQKSIVRNICRVDKSHHTSELLKSLLFLPIHSIYEYMSHFCSQKSFQSYNWLEYYSGVYNIRLLQQITLVVPFARTNIYKRSLRIDAAVKWNGLPDELRRIEN